MLSEESWKTSRDYIDALFSLHNRALDKLKVISDSSFYTVFENETKRRRDMAKAEAVADRIYKFLMRRLNEAHSVLNQAI